jgi:hypothetical protein
LCSTASRVEEPRAIGVPDATTNSRTPRQGLIDGEEKAFDGAGVAAALRRTLEIALNAEQEAGIETGIKTGSCRLNGNALSRRRSRHGQVGGADRKCRQDDGDPGSKMARADMSHTSRLGPRNSQNVATRPADGTWRSNPPGFFGSHCRTTPVGL